MDHVLLERKAAELRRILFEMLSSVKQGHPGSVMSQIEILTALFYGGVMRYEKGNADVHWRDRIIISKGHATMGLYPIFSELGGYDIDNILDKADPERSETRISADDTHPNGLGQTMITEEIYNAYAKIYT